MRHHRRLTCISLVMTGGLASAGCGAPPSERVEVVGGAPQADAFSSFERPEALVGGASRRLAQIISVADIGRDFTVPDGRVPYPDTYWPFIKGGTDAQWNQRGRDWRSPLEKYMALTDPYRTAAAKAWEFQNHGPGAPGVASWYGHCPGWTAAALSNTPILHPVFAASDGRGGIFSCREGTLGCIRFEIGDVNALMAEVYLDGPHSLIGTICNTPLGAIPRDRYGRIVKRGCDGVNAGSLLVAVSTLLKGYHLPFAIERQTPASTDQIWNQPAYRYHVYDYHPLTTAEAANLVAHGTTAGSETFYPWNPAARGFAFVDLGLGFVGENGPQVEVVSGTRSTYEMRVAAVIELDAGAADPRATILGGEYLDLPASHADRLTVPPFLWVTHGVGPETLPWYVDGSHHNPFVRPSLVKQLMALGQR